MADARDAKPAAKTVTTKEVLERCEFLEKEVRRLKAELDKNNDANRTIFGLSAIVVNADANQKIYYVNHTFEENFLVKRSEVAGKTLDELDELHGPRIGFKLAYMQAVQAGGKYTSEFSVGDGKGGIRYLRLTATINADNGAEFFIEDQSEQKLLENTFRRYVSPKIIDELVRNHFDPKIASRREISILFADLRGFTNFCSKNMPDQVKLLIDDFLNGMMRIIVDHDATVDKVVGDEVMALFGAPFYYPDHAWRAVRVAIAMQDEHKKLMRKWQEKGFPALQVGIGIGTGEVVVGNIGGEVQMSYTALGHTVNMSNRLCSNAKGGEILISTRTFELARRWLESNASEISRPLKFRKGPHLQVKGIDAPIPTITVHADE